MPLFKRKPFSLLEPPKDIDPKEKVFQIRFTREIFREYQDYISRLNLYRQRVWTCKISGKSNLTFEEALVSEHHAVAKAQKLPTELMAPVLRMIQYSTVGLYELVDKIYASLQEYVFEGLELHAKQDGLEAACKILKILESGGTKMYEVGWLLRDKTIISISVIKGEDLIHRRPPVSRNTLKIFIRDATSQNNPWVIHENLAKRYGIPTEPPNDMMFDEGLQKKGRKRHEDGPKGNARKKMKNDEEHINVPVKYPMDDLLVRPSADDHVLSKRLPLATDFRVPRYSVGDLLMVWDFCLSFGRILNLSPFSLADLENAICHKESNTLLVEIHKSIFHLLIKDEGDYFTVLRNKKRKLKVTLVTWAEYLCDFLEMTKSEELSSNIATVRKGYYSLIDTDVKLKILRELVEEAITTSPVREKLSEWVDQRQTLAATKRECTRKAKDEQNSSIDAVQDDNGNVDEQGKGKEEKDKNNISRSKKNGKRHGHLEMEIDKLSIRSSPLGKDRHYNRYWFFRREGRLFVESADSREWGYYSTKEELDALMCSLNMKGIRERALKQQMDKLYSKISNALEKRSKEITNKLLLEEVVLRRSTRVQAQPRDNPSMAFLKYVNKWKDN
ncbi:DDT domain-containing protein DDB_G0282237-like [Oryza brachyantha]|uniref:DDT domain-containing protein n=1 Tax=Oryza brachyantha TaxID=4533 RepID=J3LDU0_ORYBR|nr:DDT domain-containing protein DDB_G0282237-like [Oryza brachyantha]